ncbi:ligand-binding sensor domain-containing diguanylate cyclase [Aliidiomarina haloalkalitolerans]|uniref:ligand-binding sensor domain-containing diguanylate cyclase n=1 Tax=Aliidiomarina haloalkalitolerans TaxID=859059 RepID=UPI0018E52686|nr:ligand-binding sensor domain-containing diguanylate cyclase [Aliidiomarina haloalkalitolerans]
MFKSTTSSLLQCAFIVLLGVQALSAFAAQLPDTKSPDTISSDTISSNNNANIFPQLPELSKPITQYTLTSWNTRDGLPHNSVNKITQTADGYLWLATWEGPVRFNGRTFTVFDDLDQLQMEETGVIDIQPDSSGYGVIASGPRGGITTFRHGRWQALESAPDFVNETATTSNGEIWAVASNAGVVRYFPDGQRQIYSMVDGLPDGYAFRVYIVHQQSPMSVHPDAVYFDEIWVATQRGVARFNQDTNQFEILELLPAELFRDLIRLRTGHLVATSASGLYFCLPDLSACEVYPEAIDGIITSIHEGLNGELWFGTFAHGLGRITSDGIDYLTVEHGLPNQHVLDVFQDSEGNIWASTHGGLAQLRDALFTSFTRVQGVKGNFIRSVQEAADGAVWVGSNEGLTRILGSQITPIDHPEQLANVSVLSLARYQDLGLLIGTYTDGLLLLIDNQVLAQFGREQGLFIPEVRAVVYDSAADIIWAGSPEGLFALRFNGSGFEQLQHFTVASGLAADFVSSLEIDSEGTLWVGSITGLSQLTRIYHDSEEWQTQAIDLSAFTVAQNLFAIFQHHERLWFATDRGILIHELSDQSWHWLSREHGLPFDKFFSVNFDADEALWIGSSRGIVRVPAEQWQAFLNGESNQVVPVVYGSTDGMVSNQINSGGPSSVRDSSGQLWFASAAGTVVIDPEDIEGHGITPPPVVIDGVYVDGQAIADVSQIPNRFGRIEFRYSGLGFRMTQQLQYRVQLVGFDSDWIRRDQQTYSEYTALPSGRYEFVVQTRYPGSEWSPAVSYYFQVTPRYYEYPWFWGGIIIVIMLLGYLFIRIRVSALERSRNELKRLVQEQTKELQALANEDVLTKLPNRRAFDHALRANLHKATKLHQPLCLAILDLDHFKLINDRHLHAVGDQVLKRVGQIIRDNIRDQDYAARWGGEEFAIVFGNTSESEGVVICERIRKAIESADYSDIASNVQPTLSIGMACRIGQEGHSTMLIHADKALYQAKEQGRNRVCVFRK